MTIVEAIKEAMKAKGQPLTIREAYDGIIAGSFYAFHAENPLGVVTSQIRRHCKGLDFPSAADTKHFEFCGDNRYFYLDKPIRESSTKIVSREGASPRALLKELKQLHRRYEHELRSSILAQLRKLDPSTFEHFGQKLLQAYGFLEVVVTRFTKDGGIDGHGKLKVGLAHLNVAFQCKRYTKGSVSRPEIDAFRGAIQGQYEQGIFFTTSSYASGAEAASFRPGAVPIILIDGNSIVDLMIEKQFGVQVEQIPVYSYALDLAFSDDSVTPPKA
jgi:restriction system protein